MDRARNELDPNEALWARADRTTIPAWQRPAPRRQRPTRPWWMRLITR